MDFVNYISLNQMSRRSWNPDDECPADYSALLAEDEEFPDSEESEEDVAIGPDESEEEAHLGRDNESDSEEDMSFNIMNMPVYEDTGAEEILLDPHSPLPSTSGGRGFQDDHGRGFQDDHGRGFQDDNGRGFQDDHGADSRTTTGADSRTTTGADSRTTTGAEVEPWMWRRRSFARRTMSTQETEMQSALAVPSEMISVQQKVPVSRAITRNNSNLYNVAQTPNYIKLLPKTDQTFNPTPIHTPMETTRTFQAAEPAGNWTNDYLPSPITNQQESLQIGEAIPCAVTNRSVGINATQIARFITLPPVATVTDNIGIYTNVQTIPSNHVEAQDMVQGINAGVSAAPTLERVSVPKPQVKRKRAVLARSQPPIHLLKTGETYRSLEKLDDEKLKLITNALMSIGDPLTSKKKSVFDGATKTRVKYRVIYPEDFDISETSEITIKGLGKKQTRSNQKTQAQGQNLDKQRSNEHASIDNPTVSSCPVPSNIACTDEQNMSSEPTQENLQEKAVVAVKKPKYKRKKKKIKADEQEYDAKEEIAKVTRSGRTVKRPKSRKQEDVPKPKFRKLTYIDVLTCLYCHEKFHGVAKLNRHYETYPTHKPNHTHTNLFQCFLGIMKETPASDKSYTFIEQLESLIVKIKNMLPCMINNIDSNDGKLCCINEDLGRMLEIEPGKYNISFEEAIRCYENKRVIANCKHLMRTNNISSSDLSKPSQLWVAKHNEEIALLENQEADCARTNSIDKWPSIKKRIKKYIPINRLNENNQSPSHNVDVTTINQNEEGAQNINIHSQMANIWFKPKNTKIGNKNRSLLKMLGSGPIPILNLDELPKHVDQKIRSLQAPFVTEENICVESNELIQAQNEKHFERFQSTHFDVRSSPIKASNTSFNKIQIKDNSSLLIKLAHDDASSNKEVNKPVLKSDVSNIQLDLNGMFSEMSNRSGSKPLNQALPQTTTRQQIKLTDLYDTQSDDRLEPMSLDMDANQKGYAVPLNTNSTSYCDISQNSIVQNDHLLSSDITEIQPNFLLSSSTNRISQNDRLLSGGNVPINQNDHLLSSGNTRHNDRLLSSGNVEISQNNHILSSRNQNDCLFLNANAQMSQNNLLSSENAHTSQSDRLLSSGNAAISQNDRLLSSGNVPISQSDSLVNMCVNESNLEGSRMGLQLLDHLGTDCLSFTDTELRNASLDLPLDLFPFNNTE